jgi:glycine/D-amino acid oxidase-like deaminating enzyme
VRILLNATVTSIKAAESQSLSTVAVLSLFDQPSIEIKNLVIAAGPWSGRVLKTLFPAAQIQISLDTLSSSSNHLTVRSPRWRPSDDSAGCHQLFLDKVLSRPLDISSHLNGTLYIGSYGAEPEELPALATEVKPQQGAIDHIKQLCRRMLDLPEEEDLEIVQPGRCYRPVVKQGRPIIAEVPLALLCDPSESSLPYRVFLNVGHGSYGITLGLGSGKVMSQLIMGVKPSANISGLGYK